MRPESVNYLTKFAQGGILDRIRNAFSNMFSSRATLPNAKGTSIRVQKAPPKKPVRSKSSGIMGPYERAQLKNSRKPLYRSHSGNTVEGLRRRMFVKKHTGRGGYGR